MTMTVTTAAAQTKVTYGGQFTTVWAPRVSRDAAQEHVAAVETALGQQRQTVERALSAVDLLANVALSGASPIAALNVVKILTQRLAGA